MIICVACEKGGVGKSTIATNLAVGLTLRGSSVILVDGDQQGTALEWANIREEEGVEPMVTVVHRDGRVDALVQKFNQKFDYVIVDVGGRAGITMKSAIKAADLLMVPFAPRAFDLWVIDNMQHLIQEMQLVNENLKAMTVLTFCPTHHQVDSAEAAYQEISDQYAETLPVCPVKIHTRKIYSDAGAKGTSVLEEPKNKASDEISALLDHIVGL